ncbi:hypothetical protein BAE44_0007027, partial [Dichanthelium oligosanthes]
ARGRASVVCDPPEAEGSKGRVWRSLGSAGGRLRLCAFDIRDEESSNMPPHDDVEGVHDVWVMDAAGGASWRRVHEAVGGRHPRADGGRRTEGRADGPGAGADRKIGGSRFFPLPTRRGSSRSAPSDSSRERTAFLTFGSPPSFSRGAEQLRALPNGAYEHVLS